MRVIATSGYSTLAWQAALIWMLSAIMKVWLLPSLFAE